MPVVKTRPRLREILKERKITQEKLAQMAKIPQGSISRFDSRTRHDSDHMFSIARVLGITVEELFHVEVIEEE